MPRRPFFRALWKILVSVKTAVVLFLLLALLSLLATLVPQGREQDFYLERYPVPLGRSILALQYDTFFSSSLFGFFCTAFGLNLGCCATDRFVRRLRRKAPFRLGPDLVHLGLLVLMAAGLVTTWGRDEGTAWLAEGDSVRLPDGGSLKLLSFVFEQYPDGRPKEWVSTVQVTRGTEVVIPEFAIEVNRPLRLGKIRLYQSSWDMEATAVMVDEGGRRREIAQGQAVQSGAATLVLGGIETRGSDELARFGRFGADGSEEGLSVALGESLDGLRLESLDTRFLTGLKAVQDSGFPIAMVGALLLVGGLALWAVQKRRDT